MGIHFFEKPKNERKKIRSGVISIDIFETIILSSIFYIWFMPFLLSGVLIRVVKNIKEGTSGKADFHLLGWTLFIIIMPLYCMLWYIAEYI